MRRQFEYQVCRVNYQRVTFVNDAWQGTAGPESARREADLQSCPVLWDYLQRAGRDGWELVSVVDSQLPSATPPSLLTHGPPPVAYQLLFLKRELGG